jgi:phage terminase Nu1 subunit (DNA packaging protein)
MHEDHLSIEEAASRFDVTVLTIRTWIRKGAPVVASGRRGVRYAIDPDALRIWLKGYNPARFERMSHRQAGLSHAQ